MDNPARRGGFALFVLLSAASVFPACAGSDPEARDQQNDGSEADPEALASGTVGQAAANSCDTSSVKGLSLQIIAEGNCLRAGAYSAVPKAGKVVFGSNVFAKLQAPGRDQLVAALKANPSKAISINSMLRTVAQQYLVYTWYQASHRCGIELAATPGSSNHETGLALDTSQYAAWTSILKAHGFRWFGNGDKVHFDYVGAGAKDYSGLDVQAFQRLWNRNHPSDKIAEDGEWGPQTNARMTKSPAKGFAKGASCASAAATTEIAELDPAATTDADTDDPNAEDLAPPAKTACDACVDSICAVDSTCCNDADWNETCAAHAQASCTAACSE